MQEQAMFMTRIHSIFSAPIPKVVVAFIMAIFSPVAPALIGLFVLIGIDLIIGAWLAIRKNEFSSKRFRQGTSKFIIYPIAIMVVRLGEQQLLYALGKDINYLASFLIFYFSCTEMISILENLAKLGVAIPSPLLIFIRKQMDVQKLPKK